MFEVRVYVGDCLIECLPFDIEEAAIEYASTFQDKGFKVRII